MSEWTHRYLFYTLDYNPILLYFPFQVVPALAIEKSLRCVFLCHILIISFSFFSHHFFFKSTFYLLGLQNTPGSFYIFSAPALEPAISPRDLVPFIEEWY